MRWSERISIPVLATGILFSIGRAAEPASTPVKTVPERPASARTAPSARKPADQPALSGLDRLLPIGKFALAVSIPAVDERGVMTSMTRMDKITRLDAENFALEGLTITSFNNRQIDPATGRRLPTVIEIPRGTYHEPSKTLKSEEPCRLRKPDMDLTGQSLIYQSAEGVGVMKGHVRMVIHGPLQPQPAPPADGK